MESANRTGLVHYRTAAVGGVNVFYREAGPDSAPVVLLLHGFPSSSRMFRGLIPRLSDACHVIAPDYPAFGHSAVPDRSAFGYTFGHLAGVVDGLLGQLGIGRFAIYVMDFGAPAGFRLALRHPERLSAIIVQNAPLYPWEPQGWWATLGQYWADGSAAHRQAARSYLDLEGLRGQYLSGVQDPSLIDPDNWVIDKALIDRPASTRSCSTCCTTSRTRRRRSRPCRSSCVIAALPRWWPPGPTTRSSPNRSAGRSSPTTRTPSTTRSRPATSRWKTRQPRSPR